MKSFVFVLFLLCVFGFYTPLSAQISSVPQSQINLDINPENPGPNQEVSAQVTSFSTNVDTAMITWRVNDSIKKSGRGEKLFTFNTGSISNSMTISVTLATTEGEVLQKSIEIKPASVDLLWQSESFVPPFYKGKPMWSHQNKVTFVAMPHITGTNGVEVNARNLIYTWKLNGSVVQSVSGYGKNTYTITGSIISRGLRVTVEVTGGNDGGIGVASLDLSPIDPEILIYKKHPLYGVEFQKALRGNVLLSDSREISIIGAPFFFGVTEPSNPDLLYKWSINNTSINDGSNTGEKVFRQEGDVGGSSRISLSIENSAKMLQFASNNFMLNFGN